MKRILAVAVVSLSVFCARTGSAEVSIKDVLWRFPEGSETKTIYRDASEWLQPPALKLKAKPRAVVVLINRGPKPTEAVLLRYTVSARLAERASKGGAQPGIWTVPFCMYDRRIPWLKPNEIKEIPIDNMLLATYFKQLFWTDYWPNAIRIHVMIEVRRGQALSEPVEKELPILWDAKK